MDPVTTLIVTSAVSGAAGSFIKELTSSGAKWLIDLVTAQSPEMQATAKKNIENFVTRLAQRVERLESEIPTDSAEKFKNSLNHPSSALLIKTALVDAATTDNEEKHEILAELIAQRLTANADDMIALAGSAACSVVNSLSTRQIKILAVLSVLSTIRPLSKQNINDLPRAKACIMDWWKKFIMPLVSDGSFSEAHHLDFEHLVAMGCIRLNDIPEDLIKILSSGIIDPKPNLSAEDFESEEWFQILKKQWLDLERSKATSIGQLIGTLYHDAISKTKTQINW